MRTISVNPSVSVLSLEEDKAQRVVEMGKTRLAVERQTRLRGQGVRSQRERARETSNVIRVIPRHMSSLEKGGERVKGGVGAE